MRPGAIVTPIQFAYAPPQAILDGEGRFTLVNVLPGTYQLSVQTRQRNSPHIVVSQQVDGRETIDGGFEVALDQQIKDVKLTVASVPARLAGLVRGPNGSPAANATVTIFPATASTWALKSPRMLTAQTNQSGRYEFSRVPPGEYLVSIADAPPADWSDDAIAGHLTIRPTPTTLRSGETRMLDLSVTR